MSRTTATCEPFERVMESDHRARGRAPVENGRSVCQIYFYKSGIDPLGYVHKQIHER